MGWGRSTNSGAQTSVHVEPSFFIQLVGIPFIAFVLTSIQSQISVDCLPLWVTDTTKNTEKAMFNRLGMNLHFTLFLGAIIVVYSWDFLMDILAWEKLGKRANSALMVLAIVLLIGGFGVVISPWILSIVLRQDALLGPFGLQSMVAWFSSDWGLILLMLVGLYGFLASKKIPFLAMISPLLIAVSITILLFMPRESGFWWFGDVGWGDSALESDVADWYKEVQDWRTEGLMYYFLGFFMMNVLLVQYLEKSKDWMSDSPNVWLLFAVDFSKKKLVYRQEEPALSAFPKFWWVPYFWLLVAVVLILIGLSCLVQGDNLLEDKTLNYWELEHLNLYFERYAFRGMALGVFYGLLLQIQSAIQWNRIYRLLVEVGLLILVL